MSNFDIYENFDPSTHTIFITSTHNLADLLDSTNNDPSTHSTTLNESTSGLAELERNHAVRAVIRLLMCRSPYPVKHEDIRALVMQTLGANYSSNALKTILSDVHARVQSTFGLSLNLLKHSNKRDYVLSQNFCFRQHNNIILSPGYHLIRGFILFLIPCFKAHSNNIFLDILITIFQQIGKSHLVPSDEEHTREMISVLKSQRKHSFSKHETQDFTNLTDYLLYSRDLLYITIVIKNDAFDSFIKPGPRLDVEHDPNDFIEMLKRINPDEFAKSLDFLLPTDATNPNNT